ncbi:hypothetical protein [Sphingobacterium paramultivorum]|uniref:hypothetical protein n=1 Tax=Sphingobacterium paramultivorum TaxID=2886510 RepID=UPI00129CA65B|nr:hypothetical protein [Sphingobacterium paramultivorum]
MQRLYKRRKAIFNVGRLTVSFIGSYILLAYGEPEGFFKVFLEPGFRLQLALNTAGFYLLSLLISWLMGQKIPLISRLKYSARSWFLLLLKGIFIPSIALIVLSYIYFWIHGEQFNFINNLKVIFPISFLMMMVFFGFELTILGIYYSTVLARNLNINQVKKTQAQEQKHDDILLENEFDFSPYLLIELEERRVIGLDADALSHKLPYSTLKEVKELLAGDNRFFATGIWLLQHKGIGSIEREANSRNWKVYLKKPCVGYLKVNKNDQKRFLSWYEQCEKLGEEKRNTR